MFNVVFADQMLTFYFIFIFRVSNLLLSGYLSSVKNGGLSKKGKVSC